CLRVAHPRPPRSALFPYTTLFRSKPRGCEGQGLAWVQPDKLHRYDMPAPDRPVVAALLQPDHCLVTPVPEDDAAWLSALEAALADRKSTRLNSSHVKISYAVFCLK